MGSLRGDPRPARRSRLRPRVLSVIAAAGIVVLGATAMDRSGAVFTTTTGNVGNTVTAAAVFHDYETTILAQDPARYWRLDESGQSGPVDRTGHSSTTPVMLTGMTPGVPGRISGSTAYSFAGTSCATEGTSSTVSAQLSVGIWFRTTTGNGGALLQFSNNSGAWAAGTQNGRLLYLSDAGNVAWGVDTGSTKISVVSPGTYRDGGWHLAVGTIGPAGMVLYVDGLQVASGATTSGMSHTGYWHIACATVGGWTPSWTAVYTTATVDEVVIFDRQIDAAEVAAQFAAAA